jgi:hypothetical protein
MPPLRWSPQRKTDADQSTSPKLELDQLAGAAGW